ncbi:hypothetical protein G8A07_14655 [Roseateles sp. DAIF2]|uniref:hypothetical protein n=1 Tax=Roseateles sp. DAIF2 TaxID=2714952 RepID=UPI0018A2B121|nr:hypothetical protein [Roseateles sp. DAIF2]QPF74033.1 hypothetical protein G8A07_14655 [Roseateles sp. DAIF2]
MALTFQTAQAKPFSASSAPDIASRAALEKPLRSLSDGAPARVDPSWIIHKNFPKAIDQNFARLDSRETAALLSRLSEAELSDLAQLYVNASTDTGHQGRLLDILSHRLSAPDLGRVSRHFGFAPVYDAVLRSAPGKSLDFQKNSNTMFSSPVPGSRQFGPLGKFAPARAKNISYSWDYYRGPFSPEIARSETFDGGQHKFWTCGLRENTDRTFFKLHSY